MVIFHACHQQLHRAALEDSINYLTVTADVHMPELTKSRGDRLSTYCDAVWNGTDCHCNMSEMQAAEAPECAAHAL